jgi:hypothetical protein
MTPEDEEFNRIEMESRIKQQYVRDIQKPSREQLIAEVTVLTELVRVLSDKVAEMENKQEQGEPLEYWNAVEGWVKIDEVREHFDSVSCATIYKNGGEGRVPLCLAQPQQEQGEPTGMLHIDRLDKWLDASLKKRKQRTWVGLTDKEAQWLYDNCRTPANLIDMVEAKLKEKNT